MGISELSESTLKTPLLRFSISLNSDWYGAKVFRWIADVMPESDLAICSPKLFVVDTVLNSNIPEYAERLNWFQPFSPLPQVRVFAFMLKDAEGYSEYEHYQLPNW